MNRLLSDETDHKPQSMPTFCEKAKCIAVRQQRDIERAIVGLGPYVLHPKIKDLQLDGETWISLSESERSSYVKMVLDTDVSRISSTADTTQSSISKSPEEESIGLNLLALAASNLQHASSGLSVSYQVNDTNVSVSWNENDINTQ